MGCRYLSLSLSSLSAVVCTPYCDCRACVRVCVLTGARFALRRLLPLLALAIHVVSPLFGRPPLTSEIIVSARQCVLSLPPPSPPLPRDEMC
ncbi:hypothetical protein LZ32DRAFT_602508 [Colletotrichum eremochloae]|nr:hypothetical protein LZ32DRAFT_602508 [Colletotrichum eremochloae]